MGVASGMAATGLTMFAHSFGCFAARRMFDRRISGSSYSELPVHVIGSDRVSAQHSTATHMPFEDCALYANIPNASLSTRAILHNQGTDQEAGCLRKSVPCA